MERPAQAKLYNLTPHKITLRTMRAAQRDGAPRDLTIEPSGTIARVVSRVGESKTFTDIPVPVLPPVDPGSIEGLPEPEDGVVYIVSGFVIGHPEIAGIREDVMAPATGPKDNAIRNERGHIVAVTQLRAAAL